MATLDIKRDDLRSYRSGSRFYTWGEDEQFHSVTTLIDGGVPKPALPRWAARETAIAAVDQFDVVSALVASGDSQAAVDMLKGAPWRQSDAAASSGTRVHEVLELVATGEMEEAERLVNSLNKVERAKCAHLLGFLKEVEMEIQIAEAVMFSRTHKYAGTPDLIVHLTDERLYPKLGMTEPGSVIIDLKTGKGVYESAALQLAAYARCEFVAGLDHTEYPMPDIKAGAVLHTTPTGWALIPVDISDATFMAFLAAGAVARWTSEVGKRSVGRAIARGNGEV